MQEINKGACSEVRAGRATIPATDLTLTEEAASVGRL